jgi:hypothetical protein
MVFISLFFICIDQQTLEQMQPQFRASQIQRANNDNVFLLKPNRLFHNYIDSLLPYLENDCVTNETLLRTKIKEAILKWILVHS